MARCGCADYCGCQVRAGAGMSVTGAGTAADPWVLAVDPLDCVKVTDCVAGHIGQGLVYNSTLHVLSVAFSGQAGNVAQPGTDGGIYVPQGAKGPQGDQGPPGLDALETFLDLGDRTGAVAVDYNAGRWQRMQLTGNVTVTVSNWPAATWASSLFLILTQDATGLRLVTWPAGTKWPQGGAPQLSTLAGQTDLVQLVNVGGVVYGSVGGWGY